MRIRRLLTLFSVQASIFILTAGSGVNAADSQNYSLVVSNERSNELLLMTPDGQVDRSILSCNRPRGMAQKNSRLFVACSDDNRVLVLDSETAEVVQNIEDLDGAMGLYLSPRGQLIVSNEGAATASVVDLESGDIVARLKTGYEPDGVVTSPEGELIFIASENAGLVQVFSSETYQQIAVLETNLRPRRMATRGNELWVSSEMGSRVEIFDMESLRKIDEIMFAPRGFRSEQLTPVDILFNSSGSEAYVALGAANHVAIIDAVSRSVEKYILVGRRAWGLALSPDQQRLFVLNGLSDDMTIIDLDTQRPVASVRTGLVPNSVEVLAR